MNVKITVVATFDEQRTYYPGGKTFSIDSTSQIVPGYTYIITPPNVPAAMGPDSAIPFLQIKTIPWGSLFLNMTSAAYNALIAAAVAPSGAPEITLSYTVGTDVPTGTTISTAALSNFHVNTISMGGVALDPRTVPYTPGSPNGTLNFSAYGTLSAGTVVIITGYIP